MPNTGTKATEITVIDAANFAVAQQIMQDAARGLAPHSVTYEPSTQRLFVPNRDSTTVVALDVATNSILGSPAGRYWWRILTLLVDTVA